MERGLAQSPQKTFWPFGPQFALKIRGGGSGGAGPSGPSPGSTTWQVGSFPGMFNNPDFFEPYQCYTMS